MEPDTYLEIYRELEINQEIFQDNEQEVYQEFSNHYSDDEPTWIDWADNLDDMDSGDWEGYFSCGIQE